MEASRGSALHHRQRLATEIIPVSGLQAVLDRNNSLSRDGTLRKKEIFQWCLKTSRTSSSNIMPSVVRSDYFDFGPTRNSRYYLISNAYDSNTSLLHVGLCRYTLPGRTPDVIPIKVTLALLDGWDQSLHHQKSQWMYSGDELVQDSHDRDLFVLIGSIRIHGTLRIHCSLEVNNVLVENQSIGIPLHCISTDLSLDLLSLLENGHHTDVVLNIEGHREIGAHRSILAARSPVFAAMFQHDMLESRLNYVDIVEVTFGTMCHLLAYIYTNITIERLPTAEFLSLYAAADKYDLPNLKKRCSSFASENMTADTALDALTLASLHQDEMMENSAIEAILNNALEIMKSEEWLVFLREHTELANSVILKLAIDVDDL